MNIQMRERVINWVANYCHWVFVSLSVVTVYAAFFSDPNGEDTGLYAATLGMYAAALTLANTMRRKRWSPIFVGVALIFVGYLFAASESEVHPTDLSLWGSLAALLALAGVLVLAVMAFFAMFFATGQQREPTFITKQDIIDFMGAGLPLETTYEWLSEQEGGYAESDRVHVVSVPEDTKARGKASHVRYARNEVREGVWIMESYFLVED